MDFKKIPVDWVMIVLLIVVMVGGFWMTNKSVSAKTEEIITKVGAVHTQVKQLSKSMDEAKQAHKAKQAALVEPVVETPAEGDKKADPKAKKGEK